MVQFIRDQKIVFLLSLNPIHFFSLPRSHVAEVKRKSLGHSIAYTFQRHCCKHRWNESARHGKCSQTNKEVQVGRMTKAIVRRGRQHGRVNLINELVGDSEKQT